MRVTRKQGIVVCCLDPLCYNNCMGKYIVSDPEILGGVPVIKGTRIPVEKIKILLEDNFTLVGIQKLYPHVHMKTLKGVMSDLFDHVEIRKHVSLS